jgi:hypothetical protein
MNDAWKKEYDKRQYRLMDDTLRNYVEGKLDLPSLIAGLKALLSALESPNEEWVNAFRSEWGTLEVIYAMALAREEQRLISSYKQWSDESTRRTSINAAVRKMQLLLTTRLEDEEFKGGI